MDVFAELLNPRQANGTTAPAPPTSLSDLAIHLPLLLAMTLLLRRLPSVPGMPGLSPLALAVAAVTPCAVLNPLVGMSLSVSLNIVLLLQNQALSFKVASGNTPPASPATTTTQPSAEPNERRSSVSASTDSVVPVPHLTAAESDRLASGAAVLKGRKAADGSKEGIAAQKIDAPAELVWATLLDFAAWPHMIDDVRDASVYEQEGDEIKVKVVVGVGFIRISSHVHHTLDRLAGQLTWALDASKPSDLQANTGYWLVREDPACPQSCVVYYSAAVRLKSWAPAWLDKFIAEQGLPRAVAWLKRAAEKRYAAAGKATGMGGGMGRKIQSEPNLAALGGGDASPAILQGMPLRTEDPYRNAPLRAVRVAGVYPYRGGKSLPREPARP